MPICTNQECDGCYEVLPDVWIHPPKTGQDFLLWRSRFEAKVPVVSELEIEKFVLRGNSEMDKQNEL